MPKCFEFQIDALNAERESRMIWLLKFLKKKNLHLFFDVRVEAHFPLEGPVAYFH